MILGRCTCGADCDLAGPDCEGYVKPIGSKLGTETWVHSCRAHKDILGSQCSFPVEWENWDSPSLLNPSLV